MNQELLSTIFSLESKIVLDDNLYIKNVMEKNPQHETKFYIYSDLFLDDVNEQVKTKEQEDDKESIGHIAYSIHYYEKRPKNESELIYRNKKPVYYPLIVCKLNMISISEEYQRNGYGTRLLEYMEEKMVELVKQSKYRYLLIELTDVSESDFYLRNGFKSNGNNCMMQKKFEFKDGELFYRMKYTEKELFHIGRVMDAYRRIQEKKTKNKAIQCVELSIENRTSSKSN
jgi:GNAT superfamily N-acetyltransferase